MPYCIPSALFSKQKLIFSRLIINLSKKRVDPISSLGIPTHVMLLACCLYLKQRTMIEALPSVLSKKYFVLLLT